MHYAASMLSATICATNSSIASVYGADDAVAKTLEKAAICAETECSWWCGFAQDCSVPLLAGMFAGSDACNTKFGGDK